MILNILKAFCVTTITKPTMQNSGQTEGEPESIEFRSTALHPECPSLLRTRCISEKILCLLQAGYKHLPCTFQHL